MEPNMARLYADAAKNLSRGWLDAGSAAFATNRRLANAAWAWGDEARAAEEVLARAARRSGEETRAVFDAADGLKDAAFPARFGDLARGQAFLWAAAGLAAGERLGRAGSAALPIFAPGFTDLAASAPSPRVFVLGVVATDLRLGYATLRERARWFAGTV